MRQLLGLLQRKCSKIEEKGGGGSAWWRCGAASGTGAYVISAGRAAGKACE